MEKAGARQELRLAPVLVNARDCSEFHVEGTVTESVLGALIGAEEAGDGPERVDISAVEAVADDLITMIREEEERSLRRANEVLINNRIDSLRQSVEIKERRIRETMMQLTTKNADERIVRLHQGRLRKLREQSDVEIARLEKRRGVSVGYRRIAAARLEVG